jgi:hypothetical protein
MYIQVHWWTFILIPIILTAAMMVGYWVRGPMEDYRVQIPVLFEPPDLEYPYPDTVSVKLVNDPTPPAFFDEYDVSAIRYSEALSLTEVIPAITDARELTWEEKTKADTDAFIADMITRSEHTMREITS